MKHISVLIKPASSLCNLRCSYCFYANISSLREVRSYGRMKTDVTESMIKNIFVDLENGDSLSLAFQGGEPTLAGLEYFKNVVALVNAQEKRVQVNYAIQTNGVIINRQWCHFLKENNFLVGLSIDGHPLYHDMNRVDPRGRGTFRKVMQTKELFDEYGIEYNILCVLTKSLAREPQKVFQFIKEQTISFIQFIPCLDDLNATKRSTYALTPESFADFYQQLLCLWLKELEQGHYISIKLFDDIVNLLARSQVTACGILGNCQVQYVIEADGSVYPCDFYVLDEYRMGYIQESTLRELFEKGIAREFLCSRTTLPQKCTTCPFKDLCRGGCKRMKDAMYVDERTDFCGYQALLKSFIPQIPKIMKLVEGAKL
ncbi:SPASM domain-containing protein [Enterococcus sp. AZ163]|uniref:SPASM domain-containing protein n=1 Tax=Enterococcus sp. AZ163 TaxID=2774638 RepID=UPI003D2B0551